LNVKFHHDAPVFRCGDQAVFERFCVKYGIGHADEGDTETVIDQVARAFSVIPYENLTKIIKSAGVLGPESALRGPDEVLSDHLRWGTGGTCFSLTAAVIAVFDRLGIEAQPLLADRHYGTDTHCGLVVLRNGRELLIDPGYLMFVPTPLPEATVTRIPLGYTTVELCPIDNGNRVELVTEVRGNRKLRLTYKRSPVNPETFVRAWRDSFTWEMMTYPVLTRCSAGQHLYLQGTSVAIRSNEKTVRSKLGPEEQMSFVETRMGISPYVMGKAREIINNGTD
jgi:arylamine N-acetyltransferase